MIAVLLALLMLVNFLDKVVIGLVAVPMSRNWACPLPSSAW